MCYEEANLKILLCILLSVWLFNGSARAEKPLDHTHVTMEGNILDTPCSIDPGSRDQTISMGNTPVGMIARDGVGRPVPFSIRLQDCVLQRFNQRLPDWQSFSITFDGISDGHDFAVKGTASGVALRLFDTDGNIAFPGEPLPRRQLVTGDQELLFKLQLVRNNHPLNKGDYYAVINFGISYF